MNKYFKLIIVSALALAALFAFGACSLGGGKDKGDTAAELEALQTEYAELEDKLNALKNANNALAGSYDALVENSKTYFEVQAAGSCIVSPPLFFSGTAGWADTYGDLTSVNAIYKPLTYAQMKTPAFVKGQLVFYRFTCLYASAGSYRLSFAFNNLEAIDMTASIKSYFRIYAPSADGESASMNDYSLFLSAGGDADVYAVSEVTTSRINVGHAYYIGFYIANSGAAPAFDGAAFSMDSLTIKIAKTA